MTLFGCQIDFAHLRRWLLRLARDRHTFPYMSQLAWWLCDFNFNCLKQKCFTFNCVWINDCLIELLVIHSNTWKHLTECKQMINCNFNYSNKIEVSETIKMYEFNCVLMLNWFVFNRTDIYIKINLNNLQRLICLKSNQPTNQQRSSDSSNNSIGYITQFCEKASLNINF